ncbi:hypothetical protein WICPIJ_008049 [Wickerhamomyces pijperi]|uniref:Uncharacterized protein n=1 Tax=Wickerhamomyces pijperi TaxID=599730 RepID=A0A9P8Q177_WICPI|nr:hypothetical protein WICPIJ_008049 [Wickerhamomyces pijperi]
MTLEPNLCFPNGSVIKASKSDPVIMEDNLTHCSKVPLSKQRCKTQHPCLCLDKTMAFSATSEMMKSKEKNLGATESAAAAASVAEDAELDLKWIKHF